jgi:UDP:flavonoid glycosyltransferase YjiC (YdhE family)
MASYLVCSTPVRGHVSPLLTVSRTLVEGGHRVRFLTGSRFREEVEASGARWVPLPPEAEFDDRDVDAAFPGRVGLTGVAGARFDLGQIFLAAAPRQLEAVDALLAEEAADAVLTETMFFGALLLLCRPADLRPPVVNLGIVPLALHSRHTAPFALGIPPRDGALGQVRNVLLGWVTDHLVFGGLHRTAARMARERTGFPLRAHATDYISLADAIVQFTVADFEYPRPDSGTPVHFVGPMTRRTAPDAPPEALPAPVAGDAHPVPPWWGDLAAAREAGVPIVHLTQGTIANADPEDLILPTVRALAEERVLWWSRARDARSPPPSCPRTSGSRTSSPTIFCSRNSAPWSPTGDTEASSSPSPTVCPWWRSATPRTRRKWLLASPGAAPVSACVHPAPAVSTRTWWAQR